MRYLFVHQNFPGQYLHLVSRLAADPEHEVTFLSNPSPHEIAGVRKIHYRPIQASTSGTYADAQEFEAAMIRARSVANVARQLAEIGYRPDVVLGHNGWGEILNLKDVWPTSPLIPYFEFYYHERGLDVDFDPEFPIAELARPGIRARNAVNFLGLAIADAGQTPTAFQHATYPGWVQDRIAIVPEGVNLSLCRPKQSTIFGLGRRRWSRQKRSGSNQPRYLLTFVARNLEPYRGFHILMRALPDILAARPDLDCVIVGGDEVSYGSPPAEGGTWRARLLREVGSRLPPDRVFFPGKLPYEAFIRLLQVSAVHVYLTYPFVASWSLREAMACGCAVVGSDTAPVREFIRHDRTGLLVPFHHAALLARTVIGLIESPEERSRLGVAARQFAEERLSLETQFRAFDDMVSEAVHRVSPNA